MIRSAPYLCAIAVCAVLAHAWTGFAFCRMGNSGDALHVGGVGCHASVPHSHDGHAEHGHAEHGCKDHTPRGRCPAPATPHSQDLVLAVFSSDNTPAQRYFDESSGGFIWWSGDVGDVLWGPNCDSRAALFSHDFRHLKSAVPQYAHFEVFLL